MNRIFILLLLICTDLNADTFLVPELKGNWIQISGNPDLGDLTGPRQQPVDFGIWQAADGTWQLWSCIRATKAGRYTRLFYRWEGPSLTEPDWKPMGIAMQADTDLGEASGGLQAPHVIRENGQYHMFYGDWNNICHAVSDDGKIFRRVIQPSGKTGMFTEGPGANTRDIMMLKIGDLWYGYYTAFPNSQGAVYLRTTPDFKSWSESTVVSFGGITGTGATQAECPHVVRKDDFYYLFRTQKYGPQNLTTIYRSKDPKMFGINQDRLYLATQLPVAAPEIIHHEGQDYIAALNLNLDGIRISQLNWKPKPKVGELVFDFDNPDFRSEWKIESGNLPSVFTTSNRTRFIAPQNHFIGTAELPDRKFNDSLTGRIRSPEFILNEEALYVSLSGGVDENLYLAFVDSQTGEELLQVRNMTNRNQFSQVLVHTPELVGRRVFIRIVDESRDEWGHINFGGIHKVSRQ